MTYLKHIASLLLALLVFSVANVNATESITYIHTDHLGSPIAATNEDGSVKWTEDYQPFGVQRTNQDTDNTTGFTGHQHDDALDLTYMQARWYHPEVGRFMALDPVDTIGHISRGNPVQGFNRYGYANNNPYKYVDPDGNSAVLVVETWIASDTVVPDPTDAVLPKWLIYAGATGLAVGIDWAMSDSEPVEEVLDDAEFDGKKRKSELWNKDGGLGKAHSDFDKVVEDERPAQEDEKGNIIRLGTTKDGREVNVRETSTDGRPTLEIQNGKNRTKIRYNKKED